MSPDLTSEVPPEYPPAGWYSDPLGQVGLRWWDGQSWSEHVSDAVAVEKSSRIWIKDHEYVLAGWWRRAGGLLLDDLVVLIPTYLIDVAVSEIIYSKLGAFGFPGNHPPAGPLARILINLLGLAIGFSYSAWLIHRRGQTVGMMAARIRVIDQTNGTRLTIMRVWRRVLALFVLTQIWTEASFFSGLGQPGDSTHIRPIQGFFVLIAGVGSLVTFMWPLGSRLNQTLQDRLAKSIVVMDESSDSP